MSENDRKAILEILTNAQFVYGLSQRPKSQVVADPAEVKALRERLEAMRAAAQSLSTEQRTKLAVPWADLDAIDSGTEAVWKAAKRATPKIIAGLSPLVRDDPEAAFLIAPVPKRGRKGEPEPEPKAKAPPKPKAQTGLTGSEIAGLQLVIQQRETADEEFVSWLRGSPDLPLAEWRKRHAKVEAARREEERYIEKLYRSRST